MAKTNLATSPRSERADDETLDIAQAAAYCHLGYEAMKELIDAGEVPAASFNQKHTVVLLDDLRDYIRKRAREQAEDRRRQHASTPPAAKAPQRASEAAAKPAKPAKPALPDLTSYELTTSGLPASTPEGLRNA